MSHCQRVSLLGLLLLSACSEAPASGQGGDQGVGSAGSGGVSGQAGVAAVAGASAGTFTPDSGSGAGGAGGAAGVQSAAGSSGSAAPQSDGGALTDDASTPPEPGVAQDTATWIPDPGWDCGMPEGLPPPELGEPAFEVVLAIDPVLEVGKTPLGQRSVIPSHGGDVTGARLSGSFEPRGLGYELTLSNGVREAEEVHVLRTGAGTAVYLRACGLAPSPDATLRFVAHFEARTSGAEAWLNTERLVGTRELDRAGNSSKLVFYSFGSALPAAAATLNVQRPSDGSKGASWDCQAATGSAGTLRVMEDVLIGGSIGVGATPAGSRNIIPITGGTFSGEGIEGDVLDGGGDYQLSGSGGFQLDARYTLRTQDGELIVVRNCGPSGALIPIFETRADGPYAWLNDTPFISTVGVGLGRVYISIYERN